MPFVEYLKQKDYFLLIGKSNVAHNLNPYLIQIPSSLPFTLPPPLFKPFPNPTFLPAFPLFSFSLQLHPFIPKPLPFTNPILWGGGAGGAGEAGYLGGGGSRGRGKKGVRGRDLNEEEEENKSRIKKKSREED